VPSALKKRLNHSGMSWGLVTTTVALSAEDTVKAFGQACELAKRFQIGRSQLLRAGRVGSKPVKRRPTPSPFTRSPRKPLPRRLQHGPRGPGLDAPRSPLYRGCRSKDCVKGEEPQAPSNGAREGSVLMILRCADRPYRARTDESKETLRRSRQLNPQQRRESRHSGTAALGQPLP
jgi:hypothetical protein